MRRTLAVLLIAGAALTLFLSLTIDVGTQGIGAPLPRSAAAPADNPSTPAKVALGRLLFWDPVLSGPKDVACATCHHPELGYAEDRDVSIGVGGIGLGEDRRVGRDSSIPLVKRNSQTILNVAFIGSDEAGHDDPVSAPMFWDVRVRGLEAQALEPLKALEEMRGLTYPEDEAVGVVVGRLNTISEYRRLFCRSFCRPRTNGRDAGQSSCDLSAVADRQQCSVRPLHAG